MPTAYILMCCDLGYENEVIDQLMTLPGVVEVNRVFGVYDVITTVTSENMDELRNLITARIKKIQKIRSVLTIVKNEV